MQGIVLKDMLEEEEYWEGNKLEYRDSFSINENNDIDDKGVEASPKRKKTVKKKQTKKVAKAKAARTKISPKKN